MSILAVTILNWVFQKQPLYEKKILQPWRFIHSLVLESELSWFNSLLLFQPEKKWLGGSSGPRHWTAVLSLACSAFNPLHQKWTRDSITIKGTITEHLMLSKLTIKYVTCYIWCCFSYQKKKKILGCISSTSLKKLLNLTLCLTIKCSFRDLA